MLTQSDVVKLLLNAMPQNEVYQILAAYTFSKSSHGNLPSETLGKLYSIHRKLILAAAASGKKPSDYSNSSPVGRAFEALKTQLNAVSRRYLTVGVTSFGPLGKIGNASGEYAKSAWIKATDGKVTTFDSSNSLEVDAGRLPNPARLTRQVSDFDGPPLYVADITADATAVAAETPAVPALGGMSQEDIELGRVRLALLKAEMTRRSAEGQANGPMEAANATSLGVAVRPLT